MRAQSFVDVGESISGVIKDFRESRKEEKAVNAANDASVKAIEAALTLSDSYDIAGARDALQPFLTAASDANLSAVQKSALLAEGKAMIPNVFARFDKSQLMAIENAQLAASGGAKSVSLQPIKYTENINGQEYEFDGNFNPVTGVRTRIDGSIVGQPRSRNAIDAGLNLPSTEPGVPPVIGDGVLPPRGAISTSAIDAALAMPDGVSSLANVSPLASGAPTSNLQPKVDGPPASMMGIPPGARLIPKKAETTTTIMTQEQVSNLTKQGAKVDALPMTDGRFVVSGVTMGGKPLVEVNTALSSQEGRAKEMDKSLFEQQKQLQGATANKDSIKEMIRLIDQGVKTGFAQDAIMQFNRAFGKDVSSSETFKSVSGDVAMGFINLTKGAISDKEMTYFTTVLAPNLGNTPEGNKKIGEFMLKAVGKAEKIEKAISEGMKQNKNAFDIDEDVRKIRNADDLLPSGPDDSFTPSKAKPPGVGLSQEAQDKLKEYLPK
jgi:hypothetical protein